MNSLTRLESGRCERPFNTPSSSESLMQTASRYPYMFCPGSHTTGFSVVRDVAVHSGIPLLFLGRGPSNIPWLIAQIIVDAIKGMQRTRASSNIREKGFE